MDTVKLTVDEEEMKWLIKNLLCLDDGATWNYHSEKSWMKLTFKGNIHNVQKAIFEWLDTPPRKHNFNLLGGKKEND